MKESYLIDTSALTRLMRRQTSPDWDEDVDAGMVGLCEPVRLEYLQAVGSRTRFYEHGSLFEELFPHHVVPDSAWNEADRVQSELAERSWHQGASPVDLLVAVTAAHHRLTILHDDADFETVAQITGQRTRRIN